MLLRQGIHAGCVQRRYVAGVSNWNFNIEDLKVRARAHAPHRLCAYLPFASQAEAASSSSSSEPKRESPRSSAASSADAVKVQHKGRFEVYDSESAAAAEVRASGVA